MYALTNNLRNVINIFKKIRCFSFFNKWGRVVENPESVFEYFLGSNFLIIFFGSFVKNVITRAKNTNIKKTRLSKKNSFVKNK